MNIAQQYYHWRKSLGPYSQAQLADDMSVSIRTAENWCSGKTSPPGPATKRIEAVVKRSEQKLKQKMPRESEQACG